MNRFQALCALSLAAAASLAAPGTAHSQPAAAAAAAVPANRAGAYLSVDGIPGTSTSPGHQGWIEIMSFSFGASRPTTGGGATTGGGTGREGKPSVSSITITKNQDVASPKLFQLCASGKHLPKVTIEMSSPTKGVTYQAVLSDVIFTNRQVSSGGDRPTESMTLNFTKIEYKYAQQKADGTVGTFQATEPTFDVTRDMKL
jgi:type VI secretion system secreted protein Hcp